MFLAELCVCFEAFSLKHGYCSKPERPSSTFLGSGRVGFDYSSALLTYRMERCPQCHACHAFFSEIPVYEEACETPEFSALIT